MVACLVTSTCPQLLTAACVLLLLLLLLLPVLSCFSAGDKVVTFRYGQFSHLWIDMMERMGLDVTVIDRPWGEGADETILQVRPGNSNQTCCVAALAFVALPISLGRAASQIVHCHSCGRWCRLWHL
jgi:hypothetical protein